MMIEAKNKQNNKQTNKEDNKQQQITRYLGTSTKMVQNEQQKQNDKNGGTKQQQQNQTTTRLTVKVKGQPVGDLKEYLARKKIERAARVKSVVEQVESQKQPGVRELWRAQMER